MNGYSSVSKYIHSHRQQWLGHWPLMTEVVGSRPVIGKN